MRPAMAGRWLRSAGRPEAALGRAASPHVSPPAGAVLIVSTGLCVAIAALVWLGYIATSGWQHGTDLLLERREAEALALTSAALNRDMKGVWTRVLAPINRVALEEDPPYDVLQLTAKAFARFPYPESFVVWRRAPRSVTFALHRSDRMPQWDSDEGSAEPVPVVLKRDPWQLAPLGRAPRAGHRRSLVRLTRSRHRWDRLPGDRARLLRGRSAPRGG